MPVTESKEPIKARGFHGSAEEKKESDSSFSFMRAFWSRDKVKTPLPTPSPLPKILPSCPPPPPLTKALPSVSPPPITEEVLRKTRQQNHQREVLLLEYDRAIRAFENLQTTIAELKDAFEYSKAKQLEYALRIAKKENYEEYFRLLFLRLKDEINTQLMEMNANDFSETELAKKRQNYAEKTRMVREKEIGSIQESLELAARDLSIAFQKDYAELQKNLKAPQKNTAKLSAALREINQSYTTRRRAIQTLERPEEYFDTQGTIDARCERLELKFGIALLEKEDLKNQYRLDISAYRAARAAVTEYKEAPDYRNILKVEAIRKILMFLKYDLFSDEKIKTFWPIHTVRFLCRGGVNVNGKFVPTGVGKIKLTLNGLSLETLSDTQIINCWEKNVLPVIDDRAKYGKGRQGPTITCYAALQALAKQAITDTLVNNFISNLKSSIPALTISETELSVRLSPRHA